MRNGFIKILAGAALLWSAAASAQQAWTTRQVVVHAGPDTTYPAVATLAGGYPVDVLGCLSDYLWCDVVFNNGYDRGWVPSRRLQYLYQSRRVPLYDYHAAIGLPILSFSLYNYWDDHYRSRSWYHDRPRWHSAPHANWNNHNRRDHRDWNDRPRDGSRDYRDGSRDRSNSYQQPRSNEPQYRQPDRSDQRPPNQGYRDGRDGGRDGSVDGRRGPQQTQAPQPIPAQPIPAPQATPRPQPQGPQVTTRPQPPQAMAQPQPQAMPQAQPQPPQGRPNRTDASQQQQNEWRRRQENEPIR